MSPTVLLILGIIDKSLELAIEYVKTMPEDQRAAYWERRRQWDEFWQNLLTKAST